jgi:hypothetical protein
MRRARRQATCGTKSTGTVDRTNFRKIVVAAKAGTQLSPWLLLRRLGQLPEEIAPVRIRSLEQSWAPASPRDEAGRFSAS